MNKTIGIYYFSGTGNTELVTGMVKDEFEKHDCTVDLIRIEDVLKNDETIQIAKYDLVGIANPIIGWTCPAIIHTFIKKMPAGAGKKVFLYKTAAASHPINHGVSISILKLLKKKGYDVFYDRIIAMASNWIVQYDDRLCKQLYTIAFKKAVVMCKEVLAGKSRLFKPTFMNIFMLYPISIMEKIGARFMGKDFKVSRFCNNCGKCVKECPVSNIYQKKNKIKFRNNCNWCMRCIYSCPRHAILPQVTGFTVLNGGYNLKRIINNPAIDDQYVTEETKKEHHLFYEYMHNDDM